MQAVVAAPKLDGQEAEADRTRRATVETDDAGNEKTISADDGAVHDEPAEWATNRSFGLMRTGS